MEKNMNDKLIIKVIFGHKSIIKSINSNPKMTSYSTVLSYRGQTVLASSALRSSFVIHKVNLRSSYGPVTVSQTVFIGKNCQKVFTASLQLKGSGFIPVKVDHQSKDYCQVEKEEHKKYNCDRGMKRLRR